MQNIVKCISNGRCVDWTIEAVTLGPYVVVPNEDLLALLSTLLSRLLRSEHLVLSRDLSRPVDHSCEGSKQHLPSFPGQ